jgi:hypothetical protein
MFKALEKVADLGGHTTGIHWACIDNLDTRAITISNDNIVKIWNIDVRFDVREDPKCLKTFDPKQSGGKLGEKSIGYAAVYTEEVTKKRVYALAG